MREPGLTLGVRKKDILLSDGEKLIVYHTPHNFCLYCRIAGDLSGRGGGVILTSGSGYTVFERNNKDVYCVMCNV